MNVLDLCAGNDGLSLGIRLAAPEARTVCLVEREAFAAADLVRKMEEGWLDPAPVWSDLATFDGRQWRQAIDLVTAGFPCQPFSSAGSGLGTSDPRWLWPSIKRIVEECEPACVFLENVPGLIRRGLHQILEDLAELGFDAEWGVFSAEDVGAPHIRKRFFLLAAHPDRERLRDQEQREPARQPYGVRNEGEPQPGHDGSPGMLAHTNGRRQQELGEPQPADELCKAGGEPDGRGEVRQQQHAEMADASSPGRDQSSKEVCKGESIPTECGEALADAGGPGLPAPEREALLGEGRGIAGGATAQRGWWESEPGLGRVANGTTDRVDRLRSIGNGVVPLAVAHAFLTLRSRL